MIDRLSMNCGPQLRRRIRAWCLALLHAALLIGADVPFAHAQDRSVTRLPDPLGYVSDFAKMLNAAETEALTRIARTLDADLGVQMAIVTMPTLGSEPAASYARRLGNAWGVGRPDGPRPNSGMLVLVVPLNTAQGVRGELRIEVADGARDAVPDDVAQQIATDAVPLLKASQYGSALLLIVNRLRDRFTSH